MKIHVRSIGPSGRREVAELPIDALPLITDVSRSEGIGFVAPVSVDLVLTRQGEDAVVVTGTVSTLVAMNCGRCLEATTEAVRADIRIVFEPGPADAAEAIGDVVALTDADMERAFYDGDQIDLAPAIQEEVLAALPFRPLCREDCMGLCPECGANRNVSACTCSNPAVDPRLSVLKHWRSD